ncbi:MAG: helix-turn-helix domain-containing protein [Acetobacteraceae bacterium]
MDGQEMRTMRERHKMSRKQLAEMLGVSENRVRTIERGGELREAEESALSELTADSPPPDELPEPPYEPGRDGVEDEHDDDDDDPKPRRRRSAPRKRGLTGWQQEASEKLIALTQGTYEEIEINGEKVTIPIPGMCAVVHRFDTYDAAVLYHGAPGFWVATVKIAPRHPWLKGMLDFLTLGGDYNEFTRAVLAIAIPMLMHHGMIPLPQAPAPQPSLNGDESPPPEYL